MLVMRLLAALALLTALASAAEALQPPDRPVIFVHGLLGGADATWGDLREFLCRGDCGDGDDRWTFGGSPTFDESTFTFYDESAPGAGAPIGAGDFYTVNMSDFDHFFPSQHLSFRRQAWELAHFIREVRQATGHDEVHLVGHSMGGLASRAYIEGLAEFYPYVAPLGYLDDVASLTTLDTPHYGSPLAAICADPFTSIACSLPFMHLQGLPPSAAIVSLQPGSAALDQLNLLAGTLDPDTIYTSIVNSGLTVPLSGGASGDGVVADASQDLSLIAGTGSLIHSTVPISVMPRFGCGTVVPFVYKESHTCAPKDVVAWREILRAIVGDSSGLRVEVHVAPDPVAPSSGLDVEFTVTNQGAAPLNGVALDMPVPQEVGTVFTLNQWGARCRNGRSTCAAGEILYWDLGTLQPGEVRRLRVGLSTNHAGLLPDGSLVPISALVSDDGIETAAASRTVVVDSAPGMTLDIAEDRDPASPGQVVTYMVRYGNASASPAPSPTLRFTIPPSTTFLSATGSPLLVDDTLVWALPALGAGEIDFQQISLTVDPVATAGDIVVAEADIESGSSSPGSARANAVTPVQASTPFRITTSAISDPVGSSSGLGVRFTVTNQGATPLTGVALDMPVPRQVGNVHTLDQWGAACRDGQSTCSIGDILYWDLGILQPGETRRLQVRLNTRPAVYLPDGSLIPLTATASHSGPETAEVRRTIAVDSSPGLVLAVAEDRDPVAPGEVQSYSLSYGNPTASNAPSTTLRLKIPDGTTFLSASGSPSTQGDTLVWSLGALGPGEMGQQQVSVTVDPTAAPGDVVVAEVDIDNGSSSPESARASSVTPVQPTTPFRLTAAASPDPTAASSGLDVGFTVTNQGATPLTGVALDMPVPEQVGNVHTLDQWGAACRDGQSTCSTGDILYWDLGTLQPGETRRLRVGLNTRPAVYLPDGSLIPLSATASHSGIESAEISRTIAVDSDPALALDVAEDQDPVAPSGLLTYTLGFGNPGNGTAPSAELRFTIPEGTTFAAATGSPSLIGGVLVWALGALDPGAGGQRQVTVAVDSGAMAGVIVTAEAEIADGSSSSGTARASAATAVHPFRPLELGMMAGPNPIGPSSSFDLIFTLTNRGPAPLTGVALDMPVPHEVGTIHDLAGLGAGCRNGQSTCGAGNILFWDVGTLQPGEGRHFQVALATSNAVYLPDGSLIPVATTASDDANATAVLRRSVVVDGSPECSDGVDNDGDGFIDDPADPDCRTSGQVFELPACSDGFDNDGDGLIDYPSDPGCLHASYDFESPQCSDRIDNDGDGFIDWDGALVGVPDPQCTTPTQNREAPSVVCGLGAELVLLLPTIAMWRRRAKAAVPGLPRRGSFWATRRRG